VTAAGFLLDPESNFNTASWGNNKVFVLFILRNGADVDDGYEWKATRRVPLLKVTQFKCCRLSRPRMVAESHRWLRPCFASAVAGCLETDGWGIDLGDKYIRKWRHNGSLKAAAPLTVVQDITATSKRCGWWPRTEVAAIPTAVLSLTLSTSSHGCGGFISR
jgi:hypothetical protein